MLSTEFENINGYTALCAVGNRGVGGDFAILAPCEDTLRELWALVMEDFPLDMSDVHSVTITRNGLTAAESSRLQAKVRRLESQLARVQAAIDTSAD